MTGAQQQQQSFSFVAASRAQNLVLEAGAGTGKTTAIVGQALRRLLGSEPIAPERMVLVTFTEKAAGEIGDRIEKALEEIRDQLASGRQVRWPAKSDRPLFEVPDEKRDACRAAIERQMPRIDRLRSQTIHSFCQSLLRQFPIEAGIDPQFRILEGFERSLLYGEIYDDWIDDETRLHPRSAAAEEWEAVLDHYGYLFRVRDAILLLVDHRHLLEGDADIGSIREYENALYRAIDEVRRERSDNRITRYFRSAVAPQMGSSLETWMEYFAPVAVDLRQADLREFKQCADALKTVLRGDKKGSCVYDLLVSHRAAAAMLVLARRFIARLEKEKQRRGLLDFDDLLLRTRALLRDRAALDRTRNQFDCIFVDEFQDTDPVQAEIIDRLARDASGAFAGGKTVVVGDPKQSIYAFRRADPETYASFTDAMERGGARIEILDTQYRSVPALVETLNAAGPVLFAGRDPNPNVFQPQYHALRAATAAGDGGPPLSLLACRPGDADRSEREAEAIADWILERDHSDWRRFALLFRRRTNIDRYLEVFERREIPYVVPPMGLFLDRPAAVDLMAVLRAIAWRYDRGAAISAARTPYFALTDPEIADGLLQPGSGPWKMFAQSLESFRSLAQQTTITELIDAVMETTGVEAAYARTGERQATALLRQLEQIRAVAFAYDRNAGGSVGQFVAEIARRREMPEESEPSLLDETTNAIRILTIHGAKGLEFDTVIVPDIEFNTHGGGQGLELFTVGQPPSLVIRNGLETLSGVCRFSEEHALNEIGKMRDDAEMRRLFYVAITRAISHVAIACNPEKITNAGFGKFVKELGIDESIFPSEPGDAVVELEIGGTVVPVNVWRRVIPAGPVAESRQDRLASIEPCVIASPAVPAELSPAEIKIARNASGKRAAGILLHRVLEQWDGQSDVAPLLELLAAEQAAQPAAIELVRRRMEVVSRSATFRRIAEAETVGREMPVAFFDDSGRLVERRLDRLIRESAGDTVIDYKSGTPSEERLGRDRKQVEEYCRAVEKLTGRTCAGVIWYIDLDSEHVEELRPSAFHRSSQEELQRKLVQ